MAGGKTKKTSICIFGREEKADRLANEHAEKEAMARSDQKPKKKTGRPKTIKGKTIRVTYNITVDQANFIVDEATKHAVTESKIMRGIIDYVIAQYKFMGRA